jgi:hypothetical protein
MLSTAWLMSRRWAAYKYKFENQPELLSLWLLQHEFKIQKAPAVNESLC